MPTITLSSTSVTSWTVPDDWSNTNNTIATIGGGGGGCNSNSSASGGGGGGGAFSRISNLTLTPGGSVTVQIGSAGQGGTSPTSGGDTWFNGATLAAASVGSKGGSGASSLSGGLSSGGAGGSAGSGVGTIRTSGGGGGSENDDLGGGGGGAAGGPNGAGGDGGRSLSPDEGGGGGGGADGGSSGGNSSGSRGGDGGDNFSGTGGANGGVVDGPAGTNGGGGAGGGAGAGSVGGAGGPGMASGASIGVGGGGGGGGDNGDGGDGGAYGGGGGGGGITSEPGGDGSVGAIIITYAPDLGWQYLPSLPNRRDRKKTIAIMASGPAYAVQNFTVATIPEMGWRQWWSEPVRQKPGLKTPLQQSTIDAVSQNLLPDLIRWYSPLSLPVRVPNWLKVSNQRDFTAPPRVLPAANITVTMSAEETNSDIATFGVDVYNPDIPVVGDPYAKVSITEVPIESGAATSITETP